MLVYIEKHFEYPGALALYILGLHGTRRLLDSPLRSFTPSSNLADLRLVPSVYRVPSVLVLPLIHRREDVKSHEPTKKGGLVARRGPR
jgi:hypothetical protein